MAEWLNSLMRYTSKVAMSKEALCSPVKVINAIQLWWNLQRRFLGFSLTVSVVQRRCRLRTFTKATSVPNTVILNHRKCVGCWGFLCYVSASLCNRLTHQWNQLPQLNPDADIRSQSTVISLLKLLHQTLKYLPAKQAKRSVADYMNKHKTNFLHLRNQCPHRNS